MTTTLVRRGWVVVATHRAAHRTGGPHPWGTAHLKMIGSPRTACGELAQGWRTFWHLDFNTEVETPCRKCAAAVWSELHAR